MGEMRLTHYSRNVDVVVGTSVATSTSLACGDIAAGVVFFTGMSATAAVTLYGSADGQTFAAVSNADGSPATLTVPEDGGALVLPDAAFALKSMKLVTDSGSGVQATVSLKS